MRSGRTSVRAGARACPWFAGLCWAYDCAAGGKAASAEPVRVGVSLWLVRGPDRGATDSEDTTGSTPFLRCGNLDLARQHDSPRARPVLMVYYETNNSAIYDSCSR